MYFYLNVNLNNDNLYHQRTCEKLFTNGSYSATCYLGVDIRGGGRKDDIEPLNRTMLIDLSGINKNATFEQVVERLQDYLLSQVLCTLLVTKQILY